MEGERKLGFLTKRAVKSGRNWKRRFFVLDTSAKTFTYYNDGDAMSISGAKPSSSAKGKKMPTAKGEFELTPDSDIALSDARPFCFHLRTPTKSLFACAESNVDVCGWVSAIQRDRKSVV